MRIFLQGDSGGFTAIKLRLCTKNVGIVYSCLQLGNTKLNNNINLVHKFAFKAFAGRCNYRISKEENETWHQIQ